VRLTEGKDFPLGLLKYKKGELTSQRVPDNLTAGSTCPLAGSVKHAPEILVKAHGDAGLHVTQCNTRPTKRQA
jgi:hypothetical protein